MSHFITLIVVPEAVFESGEEEIHNYIALRMSPYDESIAVAPHNAKCYCINSKARKHGFEVAEKEVGTIDSLRKKFNKMPKKKRPEWEEFISEFEKVEKEATENHKLYMKPDPKCENCKGRGDYETTYNTNAQWDWYRVGGRWDGWLIGNEQNSENGFNFDAKHETIENNSCKIRDMKKGRMPFALITSGGQWIQRGSMGYWGMVSDEKEGKKWRRELMDALKKENSEDYLVAIDCHI